MSVELKSDVKVSTEPGFVAVSLSKVVEIQSSDLTMIVVSVDDYELDLLGQIFSPEVLDEIIRELVLDIVEDNEEGVRIDALFEMVKDLNGEHVLINAREDWDNWVAAYRSDLSALILDALPDDTKNLQIEVVVMKNLPELAFIIATEGKTTSIHLLEEGVEEEDDGDDEIDEEEDVDEDDQEED